MDTDILIVDDEKDIRQLISDILNDEGYQPRTAANSIEAFEAIDNRLPKAIILDIWLQGSDIDGLGILEIVQQKYPDVPVIIISGHGNIETAVTSIRLGAYDYIEKPFKSDKLLVVLKRALETAQLRKEIRELRRKNLNNSEMVGRSQIIAQLRSCIEKVAPTESRILITGPAGVGKEVIAKQIHLRSKRRSAAFMILNAASLNEAELESELFGVEPSQPMETLPRKIGICEKAHGGVLLIDEVADLPLTIQGKLLRFLQEQSFTRVGGERKIKVEVRVIATSSRNLEALIKAGKFREDLYYRLNVVPIKVPPLSARREDIPLLCDYFIKRLAESSGLNTRTIGEDAIATMQAYDWPGNVRQLRNVIEWLLIMAPGAPGSEIKAGMLPPEITSVTPSVMQPALSADIMSMPLREARELFEKQYLTAQINRFSGNVSRTSAFIGMERSALHRKLKSLQVTTEEVA